MYTRAGKDCKGSSATAMMPGKDAGKPPWGSDGSKGTFTFRRTHDTAFVPGLHRIVRDAIRHCQTGRVMAGADEPQIQSAPDGSADFERSFPATLHGTEMKKKEPASKRRAQRSPPGVEGEGIRS